VEAITMSDGTAEGTALFDLTGHVAAVVGGSGVLGGALCHGFGSAGAAVAVLGRSGDRTAARAAALREQGVRAVAVQVDATHRASVLAAREAVEKALGPVDILVNAAGVNSGTPFFDIELDEWRRILDTNLTSYLLASQVFGKAMVDRGGGGSIINVSSASSEIPLSRVLTYSVSKAGVNILTRYLARELAPHRIRVNALVPGFFPA
jgi:NAD(P)-dependent dehydrogenase (short-subunit alcohol dehydrogenase family)